MDLPFIQNPKEGESLYSALSRTMRENGQNSVLLLIPSKKAVLVYTHNLNLNQETEVQKCLVNTALEFGWEIEKLVLNQFNALLFNGPLTKRQKEIFYYQSHVKFCPSCMREDPYHRLLWDVSCVSVCLKHDVMLIENCPECHKSITLYNLMGGACSCGCIFSDCHSDLIPNEEVKEAQKVTQLLLTRQITQVRLADGSFLEASNFFQAIHLFSSLLQQFDSTHPAFQFYSISGKIAYYLITEGTKRGVDMSTAVHTAAYWLLQKPDDHFTEVLQTVEEITVAPEHRFYNKRITVREILAMTELKRHREIHEDFLTNLTFVYPRRKNGGKKLETNYYTQAETFHKLGIDYPEVKRLIEQGHLTPVTRKQVRKTIILFNKSEVQAWAIKKSSLLYFPQVAKELELDKRVVQQMQQVEMLKAFRGPTVDGFGYYSFEPKEVQAFKDTFFGVSQLITEPGSEWMSFRKLNQTLHGKGYKSIDVIRLLMEGGIKLAVINGRNTFKGLYVHRLDVERHAEEYRRSRIEQMGYTCEEIRLMLGVYRPKLLRWFEDGTLPVTNEILCGERVWRYVAKEKVDEFVRMYKSGRIK